MNLLTQHAALWPLLVPVIATATTLCLWNHRRAQGYVSLVAATLLVGAAALLFARVQHAGIQQERLGGWPPSFGIVLTADALSALMVLFTALLACAVLVYAMADVRQREVRAGFHPLFHGLLIGINGAFVTGDIFNLYVWFEAMLIAALGLLVLRRSRAQLDGTFRYAVLNLLSTLLILVGVAILYGSTGTLNMAQLAQVVPVSTSPAIGVAAALLLCGFGIKAGFFPLYFWLPASYHTASTTVSAIFAGVLTKVGVYACFRVFTLIFPLADSGARSIIGVIAVATMVSGVFGAIVQWDIRRIFAFQIVSQIGFILLGLAFGTTAAIGGAIFYIAQSIIVQANLFLVAGVVRRAGNSYDLRRLGGIMEGRPLLAVLFVIPALSLAGVPPLSGFWAKLLVIDAGFRAGHGLLVAAALIVGLLNLYSMCRIWIEAFWKPAPTRTRPLRPVPAPMIVALVLLAAITVSLSIAPGPLMTVAQAAAEALTDPRSYIDNVLAAGVR